MKIKRSKNDELVKSSNSRRANFAIMRRTDRTLNDYGMQRNAGVGLFTRPSKIVEWSDEDQCYVGSIPSWIGKCCHGDNEEEVYHELCQILEEWIDLYKKDNMPLPASMITKKFPANFNCELIVIYIKHLLFGHCREMKV